MRKVYRVKGSDELRTYIEVLGERDGGYDVLITSVREFATRQSEEHISRDLLDSCLRTGYIEETVEPMLAS